MPRMILRVAIALVTFGAGVTASTLFNALFGSPSSANRYEHTRPATTKRYGCSKSFRPVSELPPPPVALPDVQPLPGVPPPPRPTVRKRVTVKLPDGTVRVIESGAETAGQRL